MVRKPKVFKRKFIFLLLSGLIVLSPRENIFSLENMDFILNVQAGPTIPVGFYGDYFNTGYSLGLSAAHPLFNILPTLVVEAGALYSFSPMIENPDSNMMAFSANIGPSFYFTISRYFRPYLGIAYRGSYLQYQGNLTGTAENFYKSFAMAKAGLYVPFDNGMGIKVGAEYSLTTLSERIFHDLSFLAAFSFNFSEQKRYTRKLRETDPDGEIQALMSDGKKMYNQNQHLAAKKSFEKVLLINPQDPDAILYLKKIAAWEKVDEANKFIQDNQSLKAIPLLLEASSLLPEVKEKLKTVRDELKYKLPTLEKQGIEAYEKLQYDLCINLMKEILLISPDNKTAEIYLPRAQKRKQAIRSME